MGSTRHLFASVAVIPQDGDNVAIAKSVLRRGDVLVSAEAFGLPDIEVRQTVLEGHRLAIHPIPKGAQLLSWGLPFGVASSDIPVGSYVMNAGMLKALTGRSLTPHEAGMSKELFRENPQAYETVDLVHELLSGAQVNFVDFDVSPDFPYIIDDAKFHPTMFNAKKDLLEYGPRGYEEDLAESVFMGFARSPDRGVGTRNHVVIFALTSLTTSFVRSVESRYRAWKMKDGSSCDGVRVVAHTEGEAPEQNNLRLLLRTIAGFLVHPNVGSAIVVTSGDERNITLSSVREFAKQNRGYPDECFAAPFLQHFNLLEEPSEEDALVKKLDQVVREGIQHAEKTVRTPQSFRHIRIGLQCGGSDAFSGIHGNPLAGAVAEEMRRRFGTSSNLAESPELVGAETYILENTATREIGHHFIRTTEAFKRYAASHDQSAAGNPSGGNLFRGLYNIVLKSLGAARKKPPTTAIDGVLEYGEPMLPRERAIYDLVRADPEAQEKLKGHDSSKLPDIGSAYLFMDSPGNDLESIAGQVACGCNIIFFVTGNGAMTNFPFVPTLKIVTTTQRFLKLAHEMDIDAGPFTRTDEMNAKPEDRKIPQLVLDTVDLVKRTANGQITKGELANHAQVSIWRNWSTEEEYKEKVNAAAQNPNTIDPHGALAKKGTVIPDSSKLLRLDSDPLPAKVDKALLASTVKNLEGKAKTAFQVSRLALGTVIPTSICSAEIARSIAAEYNETNKLNLRWVCPVHTEGCGVMGNDYWEYSYLRLLLSFATHRSVRTALFLEHGCEKTHNDVFKQAMEQCGVSQLTHEVGFQSVQKDGGIHAVREKVAQYFKEAPLRPAPTTLASTPFTIALVIHRPTRIPPTAKLNPLLIGTIAKLVVTLISHHNINVILPEDSLLLHDAQFQAEVLAEGTIGTVGSTLRYAQSYTQSSDAPNGIHIMQGIPPAMNWVEWMSGLSCASDAILCFSEAGSAKVISGSILAPMVRLTWPSSSRHGIWETEAVAKTDSESIAQLANFQMDNCAHWYQEIIDTLACHSNGPEHTTEAELWKKEAEKLFVRPDFAVPRGHSVSM
jgi:altronate dehydratase